MHLAENKKKPRILDLFCGAGGLASGFRQAGYEVVGGVDFSAPAVETFDRNFGAGRGLMKDLRKPETADVRDLVGTGVDVVVGGPSCQGFSTSGGLSKRSGRDQSDPRNRLFLNYLKLVDELQPSWLVFENVPGLLLYNQGRVALDIVQAFREIGYSLVPMILLAADFGVPQLRRRLVFVGNRTGADISFPAATHGDADLWRNFALPFAHLSRIGHKSDTLAAAHVTFEEACGDLPPVVEGRSVDGAPYASPAMSTFQKLMRSGSQTVRQHTAADLSELDRLAATTLKPGQNWRDIPADLLPDRFRRIRPYDATTLLRRLRHDRPAYTITTKFNEGTTGAFIHPDQPRTLTLREAARLQSFPDTFTFAGSNGQIRQQIGNAVPPMLAQALAEAIAPQVMRDAFGKTCVSVRDVVTVSGAICETDVLKLRSPRRTASEEANLIDAC